MTHEALIFDEALLAPLREKALAAPRLRMNLNLHQTTDAACQRFFNAMEPASYVRPHRHRGEGKEETLVVVRGRLGVLFFDDTGRVVDKAVLTAGGERFGYHVSTNVWHSTISLASGTVFLEAKAGPYLAGADTDFAAWAPAEGAADVSAYLETLRAACIN
jgi:cupin fold WbuC family metalloprotein